MHMGRELALCRPAQQLLHILALHMGLALDELTPEHTHQRTAFEQRKIERYFGNIARGKSHHQETALPSNAAQGWLCIGPAHCIINHIDAAALRG